jgi:hypothetical protein
MPAKMAVGMARSRRRVGVVLDRTIGEKQPNFAIIAFSRLGRCIG